jgi:hypothetical protein
MKVVNVPGAGPFSFPDSESDDSIYAKVAKIQEHLKQVDLATRPDPRDIPVGRVASNAFNRMGRGLGITAFKEAPALASSLFGADDTARRLLDEAKTERQALEEKYPTSQRSFEGIRGLSDVGKFLVESGVEAVPPVAAIVGTGGIGALAGRGVARYGMEAAAARAAAQRGVGVEAAEAAAAAARSKAGQTGLDVGLGTGSFGLNAPESFSGIYEETGKLEPGLAIGAGAFKALFDGILPARVLNQLGLRGQAKLAEELASRSTIVPDSFKLRLAKEVGKTAVTESGTEALQEATDIIAEQLAGAPGGLSDPKNVDRLLMAAAKGGIGGTVIGAPGALAQTVRETSAKEPELPLNETKKVGSVGPGPAENLAAAMQKRKAQEAITEDEFQLLVQNGVLKDNPQTRASVKFAAPSTDPSLEEQTNAATTREAVQNDEVVNAALAQASLQQAQQQNQQNDQVRQNALAQAQAANQRRQEQQAAEFQARQQAQQNVQPNAQPNVQSESTPPPNVTPPSGASAGVPSEPGAGAPPTGVTPPPPPRVAATEQPTQQTGVGERTQPSSVEVGTPAEEWNTQYRTSDAEPTFEQLPPTMRRRWMDAPAKTTELFDSIVNDYGAAAPLAPERPGLLNQPYTYYSPKEIGIPGDRLALRKLKNDDKFADTYFDRPRLADNLINLAHDRVFGNYTEARSKERLDALDSWVRSNLTDDAVRGYDEQIDKQREVLAGAQRSELTQKAREKAKKAKKDEEAKQAFNIRFEQERLRNARPARPAPVTNINPEAAQRKLDQIRQLNEAKIKRAAELAKLTPEEIAIERAKEAEGQKTELEIEEAAEEAADAKLSTEARKARDFAKQQKEENDRLMKQRQEELARKNTKPQVTEQSPYREFLPPSISREEFARALGLKKHSSGWLSTEYNQELADAVTKGDANAMLDALSRSKNPIVRDVANRSRALQRFTTERVKVAVDDAALRQEEIDENYPPNSIGGMFDFTTRTIYINSTHAGSEVTAVHELLHALADAALRNPISKKQKEAAARLRALHKSVLERAYTVYGTKDIKQLPYGLTDVYEFLSEGLANPEFQYLLAAIPHESNTSLWTQFVQAIADLLGFAKPNALMEVLDIYSALVVEGPKTAPIDQSVRKLASMGIPVDDPATPLADDLPKKAQLSPKVSTPVTFTPQRATARAMQDPLREYLGAARDSELYINANDAVGRSALSVQPMWYIADTARKLGFKQIGEIENSLRKAGAMKNTMLKRSSDFMTKALEIAKSDPAGKKAMDAFVNRASDLAIDVTRSETPTPEFVKARGEEAAVNYLSLRAEYNKLHPKFQKLASDLVDQYRQFRDDYFTALKKSVHDQYQDDPVKADKILSGLDEKYKKFNEAYTPFVRVGDYWITYVNPDTGKDVAESYTSLGAQKTRLGELKKEGIVYVQSFKQTDFRKFSYKSGPVNQFFDEIKANVDKALPIFKDDSPATADRIREAREEMKERLYQASLLLHPESSMLRQFGLERKGTLGYIEDTLAAYDHKAPVYATQISQVANKGEIEHQIDSARKQNASNPDTKMSDIITHVAKVVYGVDTIRSDDPLNQIANNVNRLGFTFYMGFNPASALVNLLQTPTVMFPLLAGEFHGLGQTKIMNTLFSAMTKIIGGSVGEQTYGERLVESAEAKIDAAVAKGKTREEAIAALPEMERVFLSFRDQGILNAGDPSHDFGSVTKYGSGETSAFGKGVRAFTKYSAIMFQRAEAINREAGALATYQLMKQRLSGRANMDNQEKYAEAIRKATDMVTRAHGDYQHGLAPKIFLSPTMRVIFMFKKFPAHMAALYVRLFKDMFSDVDPEVRKVARIQFAGLMGMSSLFAGTMGMPFYFIVRDIMNLALDDEDDPFDFDFAFYNYLSDMWGQPMANRITRGWLGDLGGDVASKVGYASSPLLGGTKQLPFIGGLLGLRDGKNTASAEDDLKNYVAEAAGASAGMALQIARGVDKLAQGDVYRFLEGVTPVAGLRNITKAIRLSNEGALTTRGEPIIEDVSLIESALQGAGFTPQRLASQYQLNAWQKDTEQQILDRRQSLINQKFNARARGDYDTEADINEEIQNFNIMNPEKGLKITSETLVASARTRAQQSKDTKAGIYLSKPFRQRFAEVPVYAEE